MGLGVRSFSSEELAADNSELDVPESETELSEERVPVSRPGGDLDSVPCDLSAGFSAQFHPHHHHYRHHPQSSTQTGGRTVE